MAYSRLRDPANRKYFIGGGIVVTVAVIIVIVVVTVALTASTSSSEFVVADGSPVIIGANNLADNLRAILQNNLATFSFNSNLRDDSVWGTRSCSSCHTDLVRLKQGRVTTLVLLANSPCSSQYRDGSTRILEQVEVITRLVQRYPEELELISTADGINQAQGDGKIGVLIAAGAGHAIDSRLGLLRILYELGVRYLTLTPGCNTPWISGHTEPHENITFTSFGEEIVLEMNRLGIIVDLSGTAYEAAHRVLEVTKAPVIFSKSGAHTITSHTQNIRDDTLELLKNNSGLVMINFEKDNVGVNSTEDFTLDHITEHINYIAEKIGYDHVAIGGNFDTASTFPSDLEDVSYLPSLFEKLSDQGWSEDNIKKLAGENFLRVFREVEEVKRSLAGAEVRQTWINTTDFAVAVPGGSVWQCRTRT